MEMTAWIVWFTWRWRQAIVARLPGTGRGAHPPPKPDRATAEQEKVWRREEKAEICKK
jgi:hypothetical protein